MTLVNLNSIYFWLANAFFFSNLLLIIHMAGIATKLQLQLEKLVLVNNVLSSKILTLEKSLSLMSTPSDETSVFSYFNLLTEGQSNYVIVCTTIVLGAVCSIFVIWLTAPLVSTPIPTDWASMVNKINLSVDKETFWMLKKFVVQFNPVDDTLLTLPKLLEVARKDCTELNLLGRVQNAQINDLLSTLEASGMHGVDPFTPAEVPIASAIMHLIS